MDAAPQKRRPSGVGDLAGERGQVRLSRMRVAIAQMESEIVVTEVREVETRSGNTRDVVCDDKKMNT
jgi:hypothetical protein